MATNVVELHLSFCCMPRYGEEPNTVGVFLSSKRDEFRRIAVGALQRNALLQIRNADVGDRSKAGESAF